MKYFIQTYGCDMNRADAERLAAVLETAGFAASSEEEADLRVATACSVRKSAMDRIYGRLHAWKKLEGITALTGCILEHDKGKLAEGFDLIFGIKELSELPGRLKPFFPAAKDATPLPEEYLSIVPKTSDKHRAWVAISSGCNQFCSYCAVPYTRGREVSRPMDEVLGEVRDRTKAGAKIVTLLGQNVNSYGLDWERQKDYASGNKNHFVELLRRADGLPGDFWINFYSNHPKDMTAELLELVAASKKVCRYIHLPLQSGDDEILQRMNRTYDSKRFLEVMRETYRAMPDVTLTTDIIVGFPGETDAQFERTLEACRQSRFDMAFVAKYSARPGTFAARKYEDDVSVAEKDRRHKAVTEVLEQTVLDKNKALEGKTLPVFIEGLDERKGKILGRTQGSKKVIIPLGSSVGAQNSVHLRSGQFMNVRIKKGLAWALEGERA